MSRCQNVAMPRQAIIAVIAAAALFGTTGTAQALGPDGTSVWVVGTIRIALGALTLWLFARATRQKKATINRRTFMLVATGGCGAAIYQPAFFAGVEQCGVAVGTVIALGSGPMFAGFIDRVVRKQQLGTRWYLGTATMLIGVALLVATSRDTTGPTQLSVTGVLCALAAGLGYAIYAQTTSSLISLKLSSTTALALQFSVAAVILTPFMLIDVLSSATPSWIWSGSGTVMLLHLGVLTAGVAYVLYGWGLRSLPVSTAVSITLIEPLTAAGAAFLVLGERLSATGGMAAIIVVIGLVVLTVTRHPTSART